MITTGKQSPDELIAILKDIVPYIDFVHLREKLWTDCEMKMVTDRLVSGGIMRQKIVVNSRIELAHEIGVTGVQLPYASIGFQKMSSIYRHLRVGCSVHSVREAIDAEKQGVDYLVYGHIFESDSKLGIAPHGLDELREVTQSISVPVIAIGGIMPENTQDVLEAGASGVSVLSGILLADDPLEAVRRYRMQIENFN